MPAPGTSCRGHRFQHLPRLVLPDSVFVEYLRNVEQDAADSGLSAFSLIDVHLEESIRSPSALDNTAEVGVRWDHGFVEWYAVLVHPDWVPPAEGMTPRDAGLTMPEQGGS